jgi:hypothetical protein
MKHPSPVTGGAKLWAIIFWSACSLAAPAAGRFTVNTLNDSHAVSPASSPDDAGGHVSLRSAIEAANAQSGATTITIPAGIYNLSLGELDLSTNASQTASLSGAGAANTIVNQTDPTNRVFNIDPNSLGGTLTTLSGLTIQGGHDGADLLGGAGILAGSLTSLSPDVLNLINCVIQNNHCTTNSTQEPGGGIQMAGGNLNLTSCTCSNNSSGQSFGGAIFLLAQLVPSGLNVTNSLFVNNSLTNNSGAGPDGGGAIMIETPAGSTHSLTGCTFVNNRAAGPSGETYGGALQLNGGSLIISSSTFVSNSVTGQGGLGGAIYADSGALSLGFCRLTDNAASAGGGALYNHASNGATTVATNNWWGCNGGPGTAGCDVAAGDGSASTLVDSPWLILTNSASPASIARGQSTVLTASVLLNSLNQPLTASQVAVLIGLPLTWNAGADGLLGPAQSVLQANGQATAWFTNDNTCNSGLPTVTLDNGAASAFIAILCPALTLSLTDNVNGSIPLGGNWIWTLHVANAGTAPAQFPIGSTIVLDNLPNASVNYGAPAIANVTAASGSLTAAIDGSQNLTVTASSAVTLNAGGSFDVRFTTTPAAIGAFGNPRAAGICQVDPNHVVVASGAGNNSAADSVLVVCPAITGTVGGNTGICPGGAAVISVTVSGGAPPYSVTLDNGGGTQTGASPLLFTVNPATNTTYQVSSGTDADGCPVANSGSASVTLNPVASPVISVSAARVLANSAGNQASVPPVYDGYLWSITNGSIIGPANQPVVNFATGATNHVSLAVTVLNSSGCDTSSFVVIPVITGISAHTNVVFTDALASTTIGMAFDGTNYWSCSGGGSSGVRLARYSLTGALVATYSPGLDFRSVFTKWDGTLLARAYNDNVIYQQTNLGAFGPSGVTLTGGTLDSQSAVVLNGAGTEFDALSGGVVSRWNTNGSYLGTVNLIGFGAVPGENASPQYRGLATLDGFWLTYDGAGLLSLWDANGIRITQLTLAGAGSSQDSCYGFSAANGKVFVVDVAGGAWRAFDLYGAASVAVLTAEQTAAWNADVVAKISGVGSIAGVDLISVTGGAAIPSLAQLCHYQSLLVFTDENFTDPVAMGNVLADYVDQGGGVLLQTFAFLTNGNAYGIEGRISTNGYLPFTATAIDDPASLTLVKDLPQHPLLDGVNTFNGGTTSFQNSPMSTNTGAIQVAHWSNGQALAGGKDNGAGRSAGLNFFPPSSDAFPSSWVSATDGARLMANALLWSGKIPPAILSAPADQIVAPGATATFQVIAAGTAPLAYQWRLNGTNLPAATSSSLSLPAQAANFGAYSVVVSNLYGTTTSLNAQFNPTLRLLPPVASNGPFSLFLADADGSAVATNRAARLSLYSAADLTTPFSLWTLLTNPVVPGGAQLRADGFDFTNAPRRFFRAVEAP